MIEVLLTIILVPFAAAAVVFTGALAFGVGKAIYESLKK